jgi:malonyl-CoA/methylmalonyl-CoA synthetase
LSLTHLFDRSLIGRRDRTALEWRGRTFTFGELDERSNRLARLLAARGLRAGDRLAVYLANCVEWIDVFLACVKLGVSAVPVNILYRGREIAHILSDADPAAVVAACEMEGARPVWNPAQMTQEAALLPSDRPHVPLEGGAPAALVYTSGTTGASKGAVLTHDNFAANALTLLAAWQIAEADRFLLALPLFHVHGLGNGLHCWLASGCRMRLLERFEHQTAAATFLDFRPTLFFGVPTMYVRLLETAPEAAREIGGFMRLFVSGSAALAPQVLEEFRARFDHTILERYGMSETLMIASNPYLGERRACAVGPPLPGVQMRLVDGEIQVKGANVFGGYWRREEATRAAFVDGWFRTGDLAERSPDGYYTLCGRKSDLIISGGFNIYPREIEEFLEEQPEVAEAAVVGRPDAIRGEAPVAFVVLKGAVEAADLARRCREKLASFKAPREFRVVERLPRNAMGKVQKHLL